MLDTQVLLINERNTVNVIQIVVKFRRKQSYFLAFVIETLEI